MQYSEAGVGIKQEEIAQFIQRKKEGVPGDAASHPNP